MNLVDSSKRTGFTIIELMLAMTFVSILLLAIAITVIQISNIYNKGLTMKAVDQSGRTVTQDLRRTISSSRPFDLKTDFCLQTSNGACTANVNDAGAGRLCTGVYTYIWNYGKSIDKPINTYKDSKDIIRFVRVRDTGGQYCINPKADDIVKADATELLSGGDTDVALQSFSIEKLVDDPTVNEALYKIIIEIGTNNQDALDQAVQLNTIDTTCKPPSDAASLQDFCAVNKFEFTAEAGNKGGD